MNTEQKSKLKGLAEGWQAEAEAKAKASTGWQKVLWIVACIACAVAGYFLSGCTMHQARQAAELHDIYHYVTDTECQLAQPERWITILPVEESEK